MSRDATMSLLGLANWGNTLFDKMNWPEPFLPHDDEDPVLSKEAFLDEITPGQQSWK